MDTSNNSALLAQIAHVGWGAALVAMLGPHAGYRPAALIVLALASTKELVETFWGIWHPRQAWSSGAVDLAWWCAGILMAFVTK